MKPLLSIIYVYYNTPEGITQSIASIPGAMGGIFYEIIIVDNASPKELPKSVKNNLFIKIIKNKNNLGYGRALNIGTKYAKGKYLLMVNPDVIFKKNSINYLLLKLRKDKKIGIIAPQVLNKDFSIQQSIGRIPLLPRALVVFSFLRRIKPFKIIYENYNYSNLVTAKEQEVEYVSGVCMLFSKEIYKQIKGFDENFFMYFEEADICHRVHNLGYKIKYFPKAKIIHFGSQSISDKNWIEKTFQTSRLYFLKKYHGRIIGTIGEVFIRLLSPITLFLIAILLLSSILNFYRINELMVFIGDQGWFYLSAKDMLTTGNIPLVGIPSSRPWLHQGPYWTYLLAGGLWLFNFNPVAGAYITALVGALSVFFIYILSNTLFSRKIGIFSALLYATSPLVVINSRFAYHTSIVPLLTILLLLVIYAWVKGRHTFPLVCLLLGVLYNFEIATAALWPSIFILVVYGLYQNKSWAKEIITKRVIAFSAISLVLVLVPMLFYDITHGFTQTGKFILWILYRAGAAVNYSSEHVFSVSKIITMFKFMWISYQRLIFIDSFIISMAVFFLSIAGFISLYIKKNTISASYWILLLFLFFPVLIIIVNQTPSDAYLPILFPVIILFTVVTLNNFLSSRKYNIFLTLFFILAFYNSLTLIKNDFFVGKQKLLGFTLHERVTIAKKIINNSEGEKYNLIGAGGQFKSFTMNYEYLTWWLGNPPSREEASLRFIISENSNGIRVRKEEKR